MKMLHISDKEKHEISPYLYMQFMEPLGVADASVDAAWDFVENDWNPLVIDKVRELAPTMVRFGGTMIDHYHWEEAVGPTRTPMINYCWGGIYHNQVGTHEIVDFCRKVNAEPLIVVNMESDGRMHWAYPP
ncbi:MAG: alpha-L-arabinofuranosidase, partial [Clostridia bacterium]|nr:alpha-L-arabinofuranosidase [Clostridia bacterium]